jgi:hypothetical protein
MTIGFRTRLIAEIYLMIITYLDILVKGIIGGPYDLFIIIASPPA